MAKKSKLIANQVPKPEDNRSIIQRVRDLQISEEEKVKIFEDIIAKKYPDRGWIGIKHDWSLNRRVDQWFDIIPDPNWRTACWLAGRGYGKLVNQLTPIFTETGWKTMGEIVVGDRVLDETGNWCNVTGAYEPEVPKKAYRLHLNDGTFIEAGEEHFWFSWTHQNRKQYLRHYKEKHGKSASDFPDEWIGYSPDKELNDKVLEYYEKYGKLDGVSNYVGKKVNPTTAKSILSGNYIFGRKKTTQDIVDTFYHSSRKDTNHCIPNIKPVNFPEADLPLHPKVLGYWLANGTTGSEKCSAHQEDIPFLIKEFESLGYKCYYDSVKDNQVFKILGTAQYLKSLDIYYEKTTPDIYLKASVRQRWELLQGFMTGNGGVDGASCVSYTSSRKNLADDVHWLAVSLGMKTYVDTRIPKYSYKVETKEGKLSYRINFVPTDQVFFLPRKANRLKFNGEQLLKRKHRMIVSYEEIEPYPMRCISVDSKFGAYCLGKDLIVNSNTRVAAEIARWLAETETAERIGVVCPTAHDANAVFLYGNSGLFNVSPPWFQPEHHPTYKNVTWPGRKTQLYLFSGEDPESLRGHQFDWMILDELAAWTKGKAVWEQAILTNRLGKHPRAIVTTTPKANDLIKAVVGNPDTWTITGSTQENSDNIDVRQMVNMFEGTRMGRQELHGEILEDVEGALWKSEWIDRNRVLSPDKLPDFLYIVLAIDPAMTANKNSDETGMCVAAYGVDDKYYILYADSHKETPHEWAKRALSLYDEYMVTSIVAETNQGGDLVLQNLTKLRPDISVHGVHAKRGKALRAEEIVHLYEINKVKHVGNFPKAESQMTQFNPMINRDGDDDIVDALVYSCKALMEKAMVGAVYNPSVGGLRHKLMNFRSR